MTSQLLSRLVPVMLAAGLVSACASPPPAGPAPEARTQAVVQQVISDHALDGSASALNPGDLVELRFAFAPELNNQQRVLPSGEITLPLAGTLDVRGMSATTLLAELRTRYAEELQRPQVSFHVLEFSRPIAPPRIYVMGAVEEAGAFDIDRPVTVTQALALAGGHNVFAHRREVAIGRIDGDEFRIFMVETALTDPRDRSVPRRLTWLQPGDIVFVPQTRLASASQVSEQIRELFWINGISGSISYRTGDDEDFFR